MSFNQYVEFTKKMKVAPNGREAELEAIKLADSNPEYSFIHPYDDEDLWLN